MVPVELHPTSIAAGGDAVARDGSGRVVFVPGALPGERIAAELTEEKARFARGRLLEVIEASPDRVAPPCPQVALGCGGCGWQHVAVAAQRRLKVQIVSDALQRLGGIAQPHVELGPDLPATGFRTTVRLAATGGRSGFRHARSHDVVAVDDCLVAHPLLSELLPLAVGAASEVTLRCGARTGERLVLGSPTAEGIAVPDGVLLIGDDQLRAGRRAWITEQVAGATFRVSARSFFQARPDGAEALVGAVRAAADGAPGGRMVDAYGGVGLFAATVAGDRPVTLLEWSASSVADARHNLPGAKVLKLDVARWKPAKAALVVADPARAGLGAGAVKVLSATGATLLVLVSCEPAALGRDARLLAAEGFCHEGTTLVDLFPHTPHVEAVSRFVRRSRPTLVA